MILKKKYREGYRIGGEKLYFIMSGTKKEDKEKIRKHFSFLERSERKEI